MDGSGGWGGMGAMAIPPRHMIQSNAWTVLGVGVAWVLWPYPRHMIQSNAWTVLGVGVAWVLCPYPRIDSIDGHPRCQLSLIPK